MARRSVATCMPTRGRALAQTTAVATAIEQLAPGQDYLIDNISNTLEVARDDASVGKRMFVFLGLPGVVLAAFLAAYAGSILASAQRREQANLRIRGADRGALLRILTYRTLAFAGAGSVLGAGPRVPRGHGDPGAPLALGRVGRGSRAVRADRARGGRRHHLAGPVHPGAAIARARDRARSDASSARPRAGMAPLAAGPHLGARARHRRGDRPRARAPSTRHAARSPSAGRSRCRRTSCWPR